MKIEKVFYSKTFPIGACWEKIGLEVQVIEGEEVSQILEASKKLIETWHINNNPQIYQTEKIITPNKNKPDPDIIILKKYQNALKAGDEKTKNEIEENYNI